MSRRLVVGHADEERVVVLAELPACLRDGEEHPSEAAPRRFAAYRQQGRVAFGRIPKAEVEDLVLEEVPDVDYSDIGGLGRPIEQVRDAVELPFLHNELFREYSLRPPRAFCCTARPVAVRR